jgi:hypothetical protein
MRGVRSLFHTPLSVQTRTGSGPKGDLFADAVSKVAAVMDKHQLVTNASGEEVVSNSVIYTYLADIDLYTPGSKVTVNGRTARVIAAVRRNSNGPASAHHAEIHLT